MSLGSVPEAWGSILLARIRWEPTLLLGHGRPSGPERRSRDWRFPACELGRSRGDGVGVTGVAGRGLGAGRTMGSERHCLRIRRVSAFADSRLRASMALSSSIRVSPCLTRSPTSTATDLTRPSTSVDRLAARTAAIVPVTGTSSTMFRDPA